MVRAVVTGCTGFIGSHVTERLLRAGWYVTGIDRRGADHPEAGPNLACLLGHPRFQFVAGDLLDLPLRPLLAGATHVVHLAAKPGVRGGWEDDFETQYVRDNILATKALLRAATDLPLKRLVYASTSSVYGDAPLPQRESGRVRPVSPYGVTKLAAEHLVRLWGDRHLIPWVILRYFSVFGPRQRPDMAFRKMMDTLRRGEAITLYGTGEQTRDFTYVGDVVSATWRALRLPAAVGHTINVGGGRQASMNRVLRELRRLTGTEVQVRQMGTLAGEMEHTRADNKLARELLEWKPVVGLRTGLAKQWAWLDLRHTLGAGPLPADQFEALAAIRAEPEEEEKRD